MRQFRQDILGTQYVTMDKHDLFTNPAEIYQNRQYPLASHGGSCAKI